MSEIRFQVALAVKRKAEIEKAEIQSGGDSRNMEFDPKRNLFKNLPPLERVTAP